MLRKLEDERWKRLWEGGRDIYIKDLGISKVGSKRVHFSMRSIWHPIKPNRGVYQAGGTLVFTSLWKQDVDPIPLQIR